MSRYDSDETIAQRRKQGWGNGWRANRDDLNIHLQTSRNDIFENIIQAKRQEKTDASKPKKVFVNMSDEIKFGSDVETHFDRDTHAIIPPGSSLGIREHARRYKQIVSGE